MKNLIVRILSVALILCMVFSFAACKEEAAEDQGTTPPPATEDKDWFEKEEGETPGTGEGTGEGDTTDEPCVACIDEDGDLTCDVCGGPVESAEWTYEGIEWNVTRGRAMITNMYQVDGTEYTWKADGDGKTYAWLAQATKWSSDYSYEPYELEAGTIEAVLNGSSTGVVFGATGLDIPRPNSTGNIPVTKGKDIFFYCVGYWSDSGTFGLYVDDSDEGWSGKPKTINEVTITDIIPNFDPSADITVKVEFTAAGKVTVWLNGTLVFEVLDCEYFGTEFGMLVGSCSNLAKDDKAGTLKSYTFTPAD